MNYYVSYNDMMKNKYIKYNSNKRYKHFKQLHFTAGDEDQFISTIISSYHYTSTYKFYENPHILPF